MRRLMPKLGCCVREKKSEMFLLQTVKAYREEEVKFYTLLTRGCIQR